MDVGSAIGDVLMCREEHSECSPRIMVDSLCQPRVAYGWSIHKESSLQICRFDGQAVHILCVKDPTQAILGMGIISHE